MIAGAGGGGDSVIHRAPAGAKLAALAVSATVIAVVRQPWMLGVALVLVLALVMLAHIRPRVLLGGIGPALWLLAIAIPLNALFSGWESAALMGLRVISIVALATVFSLTTSVTAVLGTIGAVLRPFPRVNADRVGLLVALTIRSLPLLTEIIGAALEARRARGVERSLRALAVPVVVRTLRTADELGDALIARGADD
ncbi:energy-coupling factor transporter transmembrane protein EcfT [Rathayibacter sp. YIM 133350]|uniref:energy-coupling factor transporter transmembrane component T family protein n=1 Tax=Rathayibacter sp. YIM 133350 TaxID=3131992 RepID=UPI00307ECC64